MLFIFHLSTRRRRRQRLRLTLTLWLLLWLTDWLCYYFEPTLSKVKAQWQTVCRVARSLLFLDKLLLRQTLLESQSQRGRECGRWSLIFKSDAILVSAICNSFWLLLSVSHHQTKMLNCFVGRVRAVGLTAASTTTTLRRLKLNNIESRQNLHKTIPKKIEQNLLFLPELTKSK